MGACYLYITLIIFLSGIIKRRGIIDAKTSRKFLHAMIGTLPIIMPYFSDGLYPFLVASPFILVTFLATQYSPFPNLINRLGSLRELTEEGHSSGLVLYAISYTVLTYLYGMRPYIVAAGIFPMAYGDSLAALVGKRYGKYKFRIFEEKSLEGSMGMFLGSFLSLTLGMIYFSNIYRFEYTSQLIPILSVSLATAILEAVSPKGLDNILVPVMGAYFFNAFGGGL
jgi:phytol kinase